MINHTNRLAKPTVANQYIPSMRIYLLMKIGLVLSWGIGYFNIH